MGLVWTGIAFLAWFVGLSIFFSIGWTLEEQFTRTLGARFAGFPGFALGGVVCGAVLGAGAWVVVRHWARSFWAWTLLSSAGFALGRLAGWLIAIARDGDVTSALTGGAVIGLIFGAAQWLALRRLPGAGWWPLANALAVAAAFWCAFSLGGEGREGVAVGASSLVYAMITGAAVAWIFGVADRNAVRLLEK